MHETQTSHYSYQVKEGDGSDRDGLKELRNSNQLVDLGMSVGSSSSRKKPVERTKSELSHTERLKSTKLMGGSENNVKTHK